MKYFSLLCVFAFIPVSAQAYVGPGAGLGAIAVALAVVLGICLLVIGFLWYPLKRLLRGNNTKAEESALPQTED